MSPETPEIPAPMPPAPTPPMAPSPPSESPLLTDQLAPMLTDLLFPSESDEPVTTVVMAFDAPAPLTVSQLKASLLIPPDVFVEEVPESWFWDSVTDQDYTDEIAKARNARFTILKTMLETKLTNRQVFRVGQTEIDIYLLGQLPDNSRAGLQTKVVET